MMEMWNYTAEQTAHLRAKGEYSNFTETERGNGSAAPLSLLFAISCMHVATLLVDAVCNEAEE